MGLLELRRLGDEQVLGHRVGLVGGLDALAHALDEAGEGLDDGLVDVLDVAPALLGLLQAAALGDGLGAAVGRDTDGGGALGDLVRVGARELDQLVEVQVRLAEVAADDVPVPLLGGQGQVDEVGQAVLQDGADGLLRVVVATL